MRDADDLDRRELLARGAALVTLVLLPAGASATPEDADAAAIALFGNRPVNPGRVTLKTPPISENGFSVPLTVEVDSPMTAEDHVVRIAIFAEENPLADVARFELGPRAGKARVQTRIRMSQSQKIRAVAELSDGSLWGGESFSIVTLAACVVDIQD